MHICMIVILHNTPQATAGLLSALLNGNLIPTFYKLNIHAGNNILYISN